jgi:hypothetical protein
VVRQASDLLTYLAPSKLFQGRDDAGMQRPPPLLEETVHQASACGPAHGAGDARRVACPTASRAHQPLVGRGG